MLVAVEEAEGFADADDGALDAVGLGDEGDGGVVGGGDLAEVVAGLDDILGFFGHGPLGGEQGHGEVVQHGFDFGLAGAEGEGLEGGFAAGLEVAGQDAAAGVG